MQCSLCYLSPLFWSPHKIPIRKRHSVSPKAIDVLAPCKQGENYETKNNEEKTYRIYFSIVGGLIRLRFLRFLNW